MKKTHGFIVSYDDLTEHDKQEIQSVMWFKRRILDDREKANGTQKERESQSQTQTADSPCVGASH